jgi:PKD repeat protein
MHTHRSSLIRGARHPLAPFVTIALLVLTSLVCVANARAADGGQFPLGQYGEVPGSRFGGFDSTWYDGGAFDGSGGAEAFPAPGKFLIPKGFAVDTSDASAPDGTAIYVLDRVSPTSSATTETVTRWRLQKLTDAGAPIARSEFFLPKAGTAPNNAKKSTVEPVGLAVSEGNIYTVIAGTLGSSPNTESFAEEIVGWSTTPSGEKLVPVTGGTTDQLSSPVTAGGVTYSTPSLISAKGELEATPIYDPRGLVADGNGSLAVLGDATNRFTFEEPTAPFASAPALAVQVSTSSGAETATWKSESVPGLELDRADTISTNPTNGDIDLLLSDTPEFGLPSWDLVELTSALASPRLLESAGQEPANAYQGPIEQTFAFAQNPVAAHGVLLSNGLFAAGSLTSASAYWAQQKGIRLTSPLGDGTLSSATGPDTVYDTLGQTGSHCDINEGGSAATFGDLVLAAGKSGAVWMLNVGEDGGTTHIGREVVEFAPGAADPCIAPPSGTTFSLTDEGATPHLAGDGPLIVAAGHTVKFSTESFEYPILPGTGSPAPAAVFAFEWDPIGGAPGDAGYTVVQEDPAHNTAFWPPGTTAQFATTAEHTYTEPGTYTVKMKALGELGEYDATGTVIVQTSNPPTAAFTLPGTAQTNQAVSLDGSGSQPASGSSITNYHWEFGDGGEDDTQTPAETHAYAAAGTYTVTLTVRDADNRQSTPVTHTITVSAPSSSGTGNTTPPPSNGSPAPAPPVTTPKPTPTKKPSPAATAKKKLAAALKVCKKKPATKRAACEKQARAKYSGKSKKK